MSKVLKPTKFAAADKSGGVRRPVRTGATLNGSDALQRENSKSQSSVAATSVGQGIKKNLNGAGRDPREQQTPLRKQEEPSDLQQNLNQNLG